MGVAQTRWETPGWALPVVPGRDVRSRPGRKHDLRASRARDGLTEPHICGERVKPRGDVISG